VYNIDVEQNSASKRTYNQQNYVKHNNSTTTLQPHTAQQITRLRFVKPILLNEYDDDKTTRVCTL